MLHLLTVYVSPMFRPTPWLAFGQSAVMLHVWLRPPMAQSTEGER